MLYWINAFNPQNINEKHGNQECGKPLRQFFFNKSVNYNTIYPKIDLIDYAV